MNKWIEKMQEKFQAQLPERKVLKVGTHKKSVTLLWGVLIVSVFFGVYKNFTAIDRHTVHEKKSSSRRLPTQMV